MSPKSIDNKKGQPMELEISKLLLDPSNPRFGDLDEKAEQHEIVDLIVKQFGVEDVLSSLSVNGFFSAEPLICTPANDGTFIVAEGNRRLTACIILLGDDRGKNHSSLAKRYQTLWEKHGKPSIEPLPIISFNEKDSSEELLSYLGVRHIASAQPWDSYAKAAWVSKITQATALSVSEVSQMIGDQHNTVLRLLEGYNFVQQLISRGKFLPETSVRKGRGSVSEYPFSWVYTFLGYRAARDYLGLAEINSKKEPLARENIDRGVVVLSAMFGNSSKGRNSAVNDSRQLAQLASVFSSEEKIALLIDGKNVDEIENLTKPIERRLSEGLSAAREIFSNLLTGLSEDSIGKEVAERFLNPATKTRGLASDVEKKLRNIIIGDE